MAKGIHSRRAGPPPDPNSHRGKDAEWEELPASGRTDPIPAWPLTEANERELEFWNKLWTLPQALMWERQNQELFVALFVRRLTEAEEPNSAVTLTNICKQMSEALGLSTPGLRSNRWKIVDNETGDESYEFEGEPAASIRSRFLTASNGS